MLIVIDGPDCSGKTSVARAVSKILSIPLAEPRHFDSSRLSDEEYVCLEEEVRFWTLAAAAKASDIIVERFLPTFYVYNKIYGRRCRDFVSLAREAEPAVYIILAAAPEALLRRCSAKGERWSRADLEEQSKLFSEAAAALTAAGARVEVVDTSSLSLEGAARAVAAAAAKYYTMTRAARFGKPRDAAEFIKLLAEQGRRVFVKRVGKWTREALNIAVSVEAEPEELASCRLADPDPHISAAFLEAVRLLSKDRSARYAAGYGGHEPDGRPACIPVVHLILREGTLYANIYQRSLDVSKAERDLCQIAREAAVAAEGLGASRVAITLFIGSAHVYEA